MAHASGCFFSLCIFVIAEAGTLLFASRRRRSRCIENVAMESVAHHSLYDSTGILCFVYLFSLFVMVCGKLSTQV